MIAAHEKGRGIAEATRTPLRLQPACEPASSDTSKVTTMLAPANAPRLALIVVGADLAELRRLDRAYEAMWREYQSVTGDHLPTWEAAKKNYDVAEHELAEAVHQILAREGHPSLAIVDDCACGMPKRVDQPLCLECGTFADSCPEIIDGQEMGC